MKTVAQVLLFAAAVFSSGASWAACTMPTPQALLGQDIPGCCNVISKPAAGAGRDLVWVAVSWEGPSDGNLYLIDCGGLKVAEANSVGHIERLELAPSIGGMPTLAVTYIPGTGTGIQLRSVGLIQFRANHIVALWKHATLDAAYMPSMGANYEEHTAWQFLDERSRIEATTTRILLGKPSRKVRLPSERYCLRTSVWRYVPCE